jgi:hypothetical protein
VSVESGAAVVAVCVVSLTCFCVGTSVAWAALAKGSALPIHSQMENL